MAGKGENRRGGRYRILYRRSGRIGVFMRVNRVKIARGEAREPDRRGQDVFLSRRSVVSGSGTRYDSTLPTSILLPASHFMSTTVLSRIHWDELAELALAGELLLAIRPGPC